MLVVFSHGKESGAWGSKITHLADIAKQLGAAVESPDYSQISNPDARVAHLLSLVEPISSLVLVGSSMGGYVSCIASQSLKPAGLFLLAPAIGLEGYSLQDPEPRSDNTEIVMGWRDEAVPVQNVMNFSMKYKTRLRLLDSDHRLNDVLPEVGAIFKSFLLRIIDKNNN